MSDPTATSLPEPTALSDRDHSGDTDAVADQTVSHYAEALVNAAEHAGQAAEVIDELDSLTRDVFNAQPDFERLLASGIISHQDKAQIIQSALGTRAHPILLRFLNVLNEHGRLDLLRGIARECVRLRDQRSGRRPVLVRAAVPLNDETRARLRTRLTGLLGADPIFRMRVEPDLLGGMIVQIGDTVYDGSVRTRLERMREQLLERGTHEIQSGRNHFGDSA